jgi:DNA-binding ferritin-like protein
MFTGMPTQPVEKVFEREADPTKQDPQPKQKNEGPGRLIAEMIQLLSYSEQLRVQAHLIHFNYEGGNFIGIHKFLKKEYELQQEHFDRLGELVRSMDYMLPMCMKGLLGAYKKFKHCDTYEPKLMLCTYIDNVEEFAMTCKRVRKTAIKIDAPDIENYMAELVEDSFKSSWFLKAGLRRG